MGAMSTRGGQNAIEYRPDLGEEIARRYADGESLRSICADEGIPSTSTLASWGVKYPHFATAMTRARATRADLLADDVVHVADSTLDAQRARNMIDARKWSAGVLNPSRYGPRVDVNINETISVSSALDAARARLLRPVCDQLEQHDTQVIEYEPEQHVEPTDKQSVTGEDGGDDDLLG